MNGAYYLTILGNPYGFYIPYDSLEACEVAAKAKKSPHGTHAYCSAKGTRPEPLRPEIKHRAGCGFCGAVRTLAVNE